MRRSGAEALLAWTRQAEDGSWEFDGRLARLSADSHPLGDPPDVQLDATTATQFLRSLAVSAISGRVFVVWEDCWAKYDLHGGLVHLDEVPIDPPP